MNTRDARGTVRIVVALVNPKMGGYAPIKGNIMRVFTRKNATVTEIADALWKLPWLNPENRPTQAKRRISPL